MEFNTQNTVPWNKGKIVGQKPAMKLQEVWAMRVRLWAEEVCEGHQGVQSRHRFEAARCDLVRLRVRDLMQGGQLAYPAAEHR